MTKKAELEDLIKQSRDLSREITSGIDFFQYKVAASQNIDNIETLISGLKLASRNHVQVIDKCIKTLSQFLEAERSKR